MQPPTITYENLLLRPVVEADAEPIYQAVQASLPSLLPFMYFVHAPMSVETQLERIRALNANPSESREWALVVLDLSSSQLLMCTGYHRLHQFNPRALEIGYWTVAGHQSKGLATLVTQILIVTAFESLDCDRLIITCNSTNAASHRVIQKCGFQYEGTCRNYYPEPTSDMLQNGCSSDRTGFQYALIPEDCSSLPWYAGIRSQLEITA